MRLEFHPQIASDISRIMDYYEEVAGQQLADEFYSELRAFFKKAADSPKSYYIRDGPETRESREISISFYVPHPTRPSAHPSCSSPP